MSSESRRPTAKAKNGPIAPATSTIVLWKAALDRILNLLQQRLRLKAKPCTSQQLKFCLQTASGSRKCSLHYGLELCCQEATSRGRLPRRGPICLLRSLSSVIFWDSPIAAAYPPASFKALEMLLASCETRIWKLLSRRPAES